MVKILAIDGGGSDSIQSYLGLEYDLRGLKLF